MTNSHALRDDDADAKAATRDSAAAIARNQGTWTQWGPRRRRLVALIVGNWVALGGVLAVGAAFEDVRVLLSAVVFLAIDFWLAMRLHDLEQAERAIDADDTAVLLPDEEELLEEVEAAGSERQGDLLLALEVLAGHPVARRYQYPTRELLLVRSVAEVIELIGIAIVIAAAPDGTAAMAIGAVLWVLGGSSGAGVTRMVLGQRLYGSPVDDDTRERWLEREDRLTTAALLILVAIAIIKETSDLI